MSPELVVEAGPVRLLEARVLEPPQNLGAHLHLLPLPPVPRGGGGRLVDSAPTALVAVHRHHGTAQDNPKKRKNPHTTHKHARARAHAPEPRKPRNKEQKTKNAEPDGERFRPPPLPILSFLGLLLPDTTSAEFRWVGNQWRVPKRINKGAGSDEASSPVLVLLPPSLSLLLSLFLCKHCGVSWLWR